MHPPAHESLGDRVDEGRGCGRRPFCTHEHRQLHSARPFLAHYQRSTSIPQPRSTYPHTTTRAPASRQVGAPPGPAWSRICSRTKHEAPSSDSPPSQRDPPLPPSAIRSKCVVARGRRFRFGTADRMAGPALSLEELAGTAGTGVGSELVLRPESISLARSRAVVATPTRGSLVSLEAEVRRSLTPRSTGRWMDGVNLDDVSSVRRERARERARGSAPRSLSPGVVSRLDGSALWLNTCEDSSAPGFGSTGVPQEPIPPPEVDAAAAAHDLLEAELQRVRDESLARRRRRAGVAVHVAVQETARVREEGFRLGLTSTELPASAAGAREGDPLARTATQVVLDDEGGWRGAQEWVEGRGEGPGSRPGSGWFHLSP